MRLILFGGKRSENGAIAQTFSSDVYNKSTQAKKRLARVPLYGRSMVEMLGVLAIIGVLSVGGIAGYGRAMFKYKLNKQAEQLNQVINTVAINARNFNDLSSTKSMQLMPYFIKLGEIPTDMIRDSTTTIYDVFNSSIYAQMQPAGVGESSIPNVTSLFIYFDLTQKSSQSFDICRNIFNVIKENSSNIYYIYSSSGYQTDDSRVSSIYGDQYCTGSRKCLKNLSLQSLEQECSLHIGSQSDRGHITILWKN